MPVPRTPTAAEALGFIAGCRQFFGMAQGQTLVQFRDECAKLSAEDKVEMHAGMLANGVNLKPL